MQTERWARTCLAGLTAASFAAGPVMAAPPTPDPETGLYDLGPGGYPLDSLLREMPAKGPARCPRTPRVRYRGDVVRYHSPVLVAEPFVAHLRAFEQLVAEVAREHYGRAPKQIRHIGTYNCRRIRLYPTLLSEHGLANGIDVAGFDFGPAPRSERAKLPAPLHRAFQVRIRGAWRSDRPADARHRAFLHDLGRRLVAARQIFRVVLGPGYPGHEDHLHLDVAPYRLVELDLDEGARRANPTHAPGTTPP